MDRDASRGQRSRPVLRRGTRVVGSSGRARCRRRADKGRCATARKQGRADTRPFDRQWTRRRFVYRTATTEMRPFGRQSGFMPRRADFLVVDAVVRNWSPRSQHLVTGENTGVRHFFLANREGRNVAIGSERRAIPAWKRPFEPKINRGEIRT